MYDEPVQETEFYPDDERMLAELLKDQWSLPIGYEPVIQYEPESYMVNAGVGSIYIYTTSTSPQINTTDYNAVGLTTYASFRVSARVREFHRMWCNEILRIIIANRRIGKCVLGPYTYMEPLAIRKTNDLSGWYTTTIEARLVSHNTPIRSAGMGDEINKIVECMDFPPESKYHDCDCDGMRTFDTTLGGLQ